MYPKTPSITIPFSNYVETVAFLDGLDVSVMKLGTERIEHVLAQLGHPQNHVKTIHIVGTNGKGSVSATLATIYNYAGYRTGMFTSPHLVHIRERIQLDGQPISEAVFFEAAQAVFPAMALALPNRTDWLTYFEYLNLMAFWLFADRQVDIAVIEAGLGGRLDSTNVLSHPEAIVVTAISLDHVDRLGPTRKDIAREKAGVFRPHAPVFSGIQVDEVLSVLTDEAQKRQSPLHIINDTLWQAEKLIIDDASANRTIQNTLTQETYQFSLLGRYQAQNLALTLGVVNALQNCLPVSGLKIQSALTQVQWPGRFQYLPHQRLIIDGSHNQAGIASLLDTLHADFPYIRIHWGLTLLANRAIDLILPILNDPQTATVQFLSPPTCSHPFHLPQDFAPTVARASLSSDVIGYGRPITDFVTSGKNAVLAGDLKILTGSLYTAGHIQPELERLYPEYGKTLLNK